MLAYGKTGDVSIDELNGETSIDGGVGGGHRGDEGTWIVGSRASVGRSQTCVGAGGLDTEEGLLTFGDVDRDGESVENERKEDKGACLPVGCHDGEGYTVFETEVSTSAHFDDSVQEPRTLIHSLGRLRHHSASDPRSARNLSSKVRGGRRGFREHTTARASTLT